MTAARSIAGLLALVSAVALAAPAAAAEPKTIWLCRPGLEPNPCEIGRGTTVYSLGGEVSGIEHFPGSGLRRRADCFYVYPTVSEQLSANADRTVEPAQTAVAEWQASRFSQHCRIYAPMYRQRTLAAIANPAVDEEAAFEVAYADVLAAWKAYLRRHNHGRPFVLIGHSQGTRMLRRLVSEEIDPDRRLRDRLVSAILLGNNVLVRKGRTTGGDFERIPACTTQGEVGCVIAWSTFDETPPPSSRFGRPPEDDGVPPPEAGLEVLCTDPGALSGDPGEPYETFFRDGRYPGVIGAGILITTALGPPLPDVETPWLIPPDRYTGRCVSEDGANFLLIEPVGSSRDLVFFPDPNWGLHLTDANIALGNLIGIVRSQIRSWLKGG